MQFAPSFYFTLSDDIGEKSLKGCKVVKNNVQVRNKPLQKKKRKKDYCFYS